MYRASCKAVLESHNSRMQTKFRCIRRRTAGRDNVSRKQLDSARSNKMFVQCQTIFHIPRSYKNSIPSGFVTVRLTFSWLKWKRNKSANLLHHRSPNQSFFCTKTILFSFAAYFLPICTAFLCSNTATSIKRPLLCKGVVHMCRNRQKSGQTASS